MKAVPMIFNTEMVQALLDGRKTVTRRPVNEEYCEYIRITGSSDEACENLEFLGLMYDKWKGDNDKICGPEYLVYCTEYPEEGVIPIGQGPARKGDLIYVRETFCHQPCGNAPELTVYKSGYPQKQLLSKYESVMKESDIKWTPSIHMPRAASRLTLKVTDVRIERVQDITEDQAIKEGFGNPVLRNCKKTNVCTNLGFYLCKLGTKPLRLGNRVRSHT
ncbi:hypothetical protein [Vibrio diazotrophicus]|uniref:hypothetical protein n=1 Tax=Vibrio diazotrophicus TaxID=685 RepID=UPI000C9DC80E|nr:hypothetical protein [Vibrio diazotrophicus]PNH94055.1 hypothetical protein C1M59_04840 [Vibrio diazotrophicus]